MKYLVLLTLVPLLSLRPASPARLEFDRATAGAVTRAHLEKLVALDTRNPPGNELLTARYLDAALRDLPGVTTTILEVGDGRANFVARLSAPNASERPVLVLGHMDVVGAQEEKWISPPLVATELDGFLYGRGVIDDKGFLAAMTAIFPLLAEQRDTLTRDVILLATAAEEGGPDVGVHLVLAEHAELLGNAEFALNEGGRVRLENGRVKTVNIQTTEKIPYNVELTATGPSGHGSVPLPDNALGVLARACARIHDWKAPLKLNDTTRIYFEKLAEVEADPRFQAAMLELAKDDPATRDAADAVLRERPTLNAVLRSGCSLTDLDGGIRTNVIPSEGTANFNVRVLPNDDPEEILALMAEAGGEAAVSYRLTRDPVAAPPPSPVTTALYQAMEAAALELAPDAVVIPFMSTGATDGAALRAAGIPTYGILPLPLELEDELRMHGDNERAPISSLGLAAEFLYGILTRVAK